ncbi:hypothetical protein DNHGIG_01600 [Collibacillus ludicampi]|uniref:Uncharacterized protein n=1 Tax=Collibacillus ludicampi TaxID=2771369 RepID=A0AAV4LA26_9BACL|nr:hypothetical protein [Collibacillus ludicampi]GIM44611.1 hypothetical protein DNHGIG_01600 [Collibacillus ludicampi]
MQINLLPHQSKAPVYLKVFLMFMTFLLLLANVLFVFAWVQARQDRSLSEARLQQANRLLTGLNGKSQKISQNDETQRQVDAFNQWAGKRPIFMEDIRLLRSYMPSGARFEMVSYNGEGRYEIKALFPDMRSISNYLYQLKNNKKIASLRVISVKREENASPSKDVQLPSSTQDTKGEQPAHGQPLSFSDQAIKSREPQSLWSVLTSWVPWRTEVAYADSDESLQTGGNSSPNSKTDPKSFVDPSDPNGGSPGNHSGYGSSYDSSVGGNARNSVGDGAGGTSDSTSITSYHVDLEIVFSR